MLRPTLRLLRQAPHPSVHLSPSVAKALSRSKPVVALESTIITHGLPYPYNLDVAKELEAVISEAGAVPATIALLDGKPMVGLEEESLVKLAKCAEDPESNTAIKASRRDIAHVLARGPQAIGGTTVSGTMVLAHMAGVPVFATGGIGGVHRGGEDSLDVSADLTELGRTPVAVFCSGPKSILDIPRTLEVLETNGVSVQTFNPSGEFPAFYTSSSGLQVPFVGSMEQAARSILASHQLGLMSGQVFGVPIPSSYEPIGAKIQKMVEVAVRESVEAGIDKRGKEATPWLLKRLAQLIPESKESNRALVVNNAKYAARTAVEMERLRSEQAQQGSSHSLGGLGAEVLVFGAAAVDMTSQAKGEAGGATTWPGRVSVSLGGVARNVAEAAHRILSPSQPGAVRLISPRGDDAFGQLLLTGLASSGMRTDGIYLSSGRTAVCSLLLDGHGDLVSGVADMDIGKDGPAPRALLDMVQEASIIAFDGNLGAAQIATLLKAVPKGKRTLFEPTSVSKSTAVLDARPGKAVNVCTPNAIELLHMHAHAANMGLLPSAGSTSPSSVQGLPSFVDPALVEAAQSMIRAGLFESLLVKLGSRGVLSFSSDRVLHHAAPPLPGAVVNTTGAGDSFAGGVLAGMLQSLPLDRIVELGQRAAGLSLVSHNAVGEELHALLRPPHHALNSCIASLF